MHSFGRGESRREREPLSCACRAVYRWGANERNRAVANAILPEELAIRAAWEPFKKAGRVPKTAASSARLLIGFGVS